MGGLITTAGCLAKQAGPPHLQALPWPCPGAPAHLSLTHLFPHLKDCPALHLAAGCDSAGRQGAAVVRPGGGGGRAARHRAARTAGGAAAGGRGQAPGQSRVAFARRCRRADMLPGEPASLCLPDLMRMPPCRLSCGPGTSPGTPSWLGQRRRRRGWARTWLGPTRSPVSSSLLAPQARGCGPVARLTTTAGVHLLPATPLPLLLAATPPPRELLLIRAAQHRARVSGTLQASPKPFPGRTPRRCVQPPMHFSTRMCGRSVSLALPCCVAAPWHAVLRVRLLMQQDVRLAGRSTGEVHLCQHARVSRRPLVYSRGVLPWAAASNRPVLVRALVCLSLSAVHLPLLPLPFDCHSVGRSPGAFPPRRATWCAGPPTWDG